MPGVTGLLWGGIGALELHLRPCVRLQEFCCSSREVGWGWGWGWQWGALAAASWGWLGWQCSVRTQGAKNRAQRDQSMLSLCRSHPLSFGEENVPFLQCFGLCWGILTQEQRGIPLYCEGRREGRGVCRGMGLAGVWKNTERYISNVKSNKSESRESEGLGTCVPAVFLPEEASFPCGMMASCLTPLPETKSILFSSLVWIPPGDGHGCSTALEDSMVKVCVGTV